MKLLVSDPILYKHKREVQQLASFDINVRYARACWTYNQFLIRDSLLTNKLMSQGFLQPRLQAAFRKFYGRYNDLVCQYDLPLGQMLSDVFHTNC
jgi:hypothetical protein